MNVMSIEWLTAVPTTGLKPSSIYIIQPVGGNAPQVFITDKLGNNKWLINPTPDLSLFVKTVNGIAKDANGNVQLDLSFTNGVLNLSGSGTNINLDARYVKDTDFQSYKTITNSRLDSLESTILEGVKTPKPFDATAFSSGFPTQDKGFQYKVTVAGTVSGVALEIGDLIIYDTTGNTPFVVQTNVDQATTTIRGLVRIATQTEVNNGVDTQAVVASSTLAARLTALITASTASQAEVTAGTINTKFLTPLTNATHWNNKKATQAQVNTGSDDETYVTPLKLQTKVAAAIESIHTHTNKEVLDKFTEGTKGEPIYNGSAIYTLGSQEW